ncbi:MAG: SDR family NAD(P)-dependent oxidoreductase [Patescibacteria group bacterium]
MKLQNKTILITGASSGIGRAMALRAAKDGATVVLAARTADKLETVAQEVTALGGTPIVVPTDVTKIEDIRNLFLKATEGGRKLDVVFNNAGLGFIGKIWELPAEQIQTIINVNTTGMILVAKYAAEVMQRQKYGHLVMTSSLAGLITLPEWSVYVASKWAITGFADSIRYELSPEGVLVTTLHPGMVSTDFFAKEKANQDMSKLDPNALTADQVAEEVYNALFTKQRKIIIPAMSKNIAFLQKYLPSLKDSLFTTSLGKVDYNKTTPQEDEPAFSYVEEVK